MKSRSQLIDAIAGLTCVTPEEVFHKFGRISEIRYEYQYINSELKIIGKFVDVQICDVHKKLYINDLDNSVTSLVARAIQHLPWDTLSELLEEWVEHLNIAGYAGRVHEILPERNPVKLTLLDGLEDL